MISYPSDIRGRVHILIKVSKLIDTSTRLRQYFIVFFTNTQLILLYLYRFRIFNPDKNYKKA